MPLFINVNFKKTIGIDIRAGPAASCIQWYQFEINDSMMSWRHETQCDLHLNTYYTISKPLTRFKFYLKRVDSPETNEAGQYDKTHFLLNITV